MAFPLYNCKFIIFITFSFVAIFSSIAIYFCLPILISHVLRTQISLSPTSGSFNDWRQNSVVDQIYLYNISNLDELLNIGGSHHHQSSRPVPKLKQVGPFTFRQVREKLNIQFDVTNETVLYDQKKSWTFLPDLSIVKTIQDLNSTWIQHMNVPLAGTTLNAEYAEFIDPIVSEFDLKLFMNHSANVLLFEGYFDVLMEQAKSQGHIDVDRFGWMHNQNNSLQQAIRVFTGPSNGTLDKLGAVDQMNGQQHFTVWHNNGSDIKDTSAKCNDFRLSSGGEFFPPPEYSIISHNNRHATNNHQHDSRSKPDVDDNEDDRLNVKIGKTISLFMPDLCRIFKLTYNRTFNYRDLIVDRYIANEFTYNYDDQVFGDSNKCYCAYNENTKVTSCPPNGMMDLINCRKGSPMTVSFPHFLYSQNDKSLVPYLQMFEDEIEPSDSEHQFFLDLEASLNIPVRAQVVLQFNVHYRNEPSLNFTRDYSFLLNNATPGNDVFLPQMWVKSSVEIDEKNLQNLKFIQKHMKLVTPMFTIILFGIGSILLMVSAKLAYDLAYEPKLRKSMSRVNQESSCSSLGRSGGSLLDEKKKYFALQQIQVGGEKGPSEGDQELSDMEQQNQNDNNQNDEEESRMYKPTTSRTVVGDKLANNISESQPLSE